MTRSQPRSSDSGGADDAWSQSVPAGRGPRRLGSENGRYDRMFLRARRRGRPLVDGRSGETGHASGYISYMIAHYLWGPDTEIVGRTTNLRLTDFGHVSDRGRDRAARHSCKTRQGERSTATSRAGGAGTAYVLGARLRPSLANRDRPPARDAGGDPDRHHRRMRHRMRRWGGVVRSGAPKTTRVITANLILSWRTA